MIREQAEYYDMDDTLELEMMLKYPVVHSNYKVLSKEDFIDNDSYIRGYRGDNTIGVAQLPEYTEERGELTDLYVMTVNRIIDICERNDVVPIFFHAPCFEYTRNYAIQNAVGDLVNERGYTFIDFNRQITDLGLDFNSDFRDDGGHLNNQGAEKDTRYLLHHITSHFNIPDRRGNADYQAWDLNSRYMQDRQLEHDLRMAVGLEEYMSILGACREEYDIIVSLDGRYDILGNDTLSSALKYIGFSEDSYKKGGTALFEKGVCTYYSDEEETFHYSGLLGNTRLKLVRLSPLTKELEVKMDQNPNDYICLDDENYALVAHGLNIIVFDPDLNKLIDAAGIDVYSSLDLLRFE